MKGAMLYHVYIYTVCAPRDIYTPSIATVQDESPLVNWKLRQANDLSSFSNCTD